MRGNKCRADRHRHNQPPRHPPKGERRFPSRLLSCHFPVSRTAKGLVPDRPWRLLPAHTGGGLARCQVSLVLRPRQPHPRVRALRHVRTEARRNTPEFRRSIRGVRCITEERRARLRSRLAVPERLVTTGYSKRSSSMQLDDSRLCPSHPRSTVPRPALTTGYVHLSTSRRLHHFPGTNRGRLVRPRAVAAPIRATCLSLRHVAAWHLPTAAATLRGVLAPD